MRSKTAKIFLASIAFVTLQAAGFGRDTLRFERFRDFSDYVTHVFKEKYPDLSFFKYRLISTPYNVFDHYKGESTDTVCDALKYLMLIKDLEIANYNENDKAINLTNVENRMLDHLSKGITPISMSFIEYADFSELTIALNYIDFQNDQFVDNSPPGYYPFTNKILFASSALNQVIYSSPINFMLDNSLILSNISDRIDSIYIDFADGNGFIPINRKNKSQIYSINYPSEGKKVINIKIKSGLVFYYSSFSVIDSSGAAKNNTGGGSLQSDCSSATPPDAGPIRISTSRGGKTVEGEYAVWYSTCNSNHQIRKPYIISVGYNPGNGKKLQCGLVTWDDLNFDLAGQTISIPYYGSSWNGEWRGTYYETYNGGYNKRFSPDETDQFGEGSSNGTRYMDRLREEGYDVIILTYDEGEGYAADRANLIIELIEKINTEKFQNGYFFENIVSGYSAGGVATRLALAQMESEYKAGGPHPHTKMWVSIETENQGANVPLGLQHLLDFQKETGHLMPAFNPLQTSADLINKIIAGLAWKFNNTPTAYELTPHTSTYPGGIPPDRTALLNKFASIPGNTSNGYPEFCRKVGVAQGSGIGTSVSHTASKLLDSRLLSGVSSKTETSIPSDCGGQYTFYLPNAEKKTTAGWWGAINPSDPLFDGVVHINGKFTFFPKLCYKAPIPLPPFFICGCLGPFEIGSDIIIGQKTVSRPAAPVNYDDAPASFLSAHVEVYEPAQNKPSAYKLYNSLLFGSNSFASLDASLHGFAPTVSVLDLHDPATGLPADNFTSPVSLNLMYISAGVPEQDNRFGFPYINHPTNHYDITPYDAVFSMGNHNENGTYSDGSFKPDNQFHTEDPVIFMGNYLARTEVAPEDLFLSNRNLGATQSGYIAEFEARSRIIVGKTDATGLNSVYSLYGNQNFLTPDGEFVVNNNSKAILHTEEEIAFLPGTEVHLARNLMLLSSHIIVPIS